MYIKNVLKNSILLLILLFVVVPCIVNAESYGYYLKSSSDGKTLKTGDEIIVQGIVNPGVSGKITGGKLTMRYDSNMLELVEDCNFDSCEEKWYSIKNSSFNDITLNEVSGGSTYADSHISSKFSIDIDSNDYLISNNEYIIMEYKLKVKDTAKTGQTIIYSSDSEDYLNCYEDEYGYRDECALNYGNKIKINIKGKDTNANLSSLSIDGLTLSPKFDANVTEYENQVKYEINKITINAKCAGENCKVIGTGDKELVVGANKFDIKVTAEDGTEKVYTLNIERAKSDTNNYLSNLSINGVTLNPSFEKKTLQYSATVEYATEKVTINATCEGTNCKVVGTGAKTLKVGSNTFEIKVTAEDKSQKTYKIIITRNDLDSDNYLSLLSINGVNLVPNFSKDITEYNATVDNKIDKISINAVAQSEKSTIEGLETKSLVVGDNTIELVVKAENGKEKTYKINIKREEEKKEETIIENNSNDTKKEKNLVVPIVIGALVVLAGVIGIIIYKRK